MAVLTVQTTNEAGGKTFASAAGGGDSFPNDGKVILIIYNDNTGAAVVTATAQSTSTTKTDYGPVTKADAVQSVEGDTVDIMGPFPQSAFNDGSARVVITYSQVTELSVCALRVP